MSIAKILDRLFDNASKLTSIEYNITQATLAIKELIKRELLISPEQLHQWYLESIAHLSGESYNHNADRPYEMLTEEQKFIDKYIANKIVADIIKIIDEL